MKQATRHDIQVGIVAAVLALVTGERGERGKRGKRGKRGRPGRARVQQARLDRRLGVSAGNARVRDGSVRPLFIRKNTNASLIC